MSGKIQPTIVVTISGGCVQHIACNSQRVSRLIIKDYDVDEDADWPLAMDEDGNYYSPIMDTTTYDPKSVLATIQEVSILPGGHNPEVDND